MDTRIVLFRTDAQKPGSTLNLNDDIGLPAYSDYRLSEHLEDLASANVHVVGRRDDLIRFSDGSEYLFEEKPVAINLDAVDPYIRERILAWAA